MTCDAFPEGVPDRFRFGLEMHLTPVESDCGIRFDLDEDLPESCKRIALRMVASAQTGGFAEEKPKT
jgi:hypothetical protein